MGTLHFRSQQNPRPLIDCLKFVTGDYVHDLYYSCANFVEIHPWSPVGKCVKYKPKFNIYTFLARSTNLPTGLYILLTLTSSFFFIFYFFFTLSKAISVSTGPIFTFFHQMEGICVNFLDQSSFSNSSRDVAIATNLVAKMGQNSVA